VNRGWLEKKERQRIEKEEAASRGDGVKTAPRKRSGAKRGPQPARATPADAVNHTLSKKRISKKINYDAIKLLGGVVETEDGATPGPKDESMAEATIEGREETEDIELSPPASPKGKKRARVEKEPAEKEKAPAADEEEEEEEAGEEEEEEEEEGETGAGTGFYGRRGSQDMDEGYFDDDYGYDEA